MAVNITRRTFNDIVKDSKKYLVSNSKLKNLSRTSTAKLILDSVALEQERMWDFQRTGFLNSYLSTANGSALEEIGVVYNCKRKEAQRAGDTSTSNFRFYIDPIYGNNIKTLLQEFYVSSEIQDLINLGYSTNGSDLIIPANTKCFNLNETITYYTTNSVLIRNSEGYTGVIAEGAGESHNVASNILSKHNLGDNPALRKIANLILCENKFGITNGESFETDENLRWRISNSAVSNACANETAVRLAAFSVPGVRNVTIIPKAYGAGTLKIFVEGITPIVTDGLLNAVKSQVEQVTAIGESVYVTSPNYLGIEIQIQLQFDYNANRNLLREAARTTIIDYINNLDLGGELIINEMIQRVMDLSDQIKDMNFVVFGYGNYNKNTEINEDYTPLMINNQRANWYEKFYTNNKLCSICEFGSLE